MSALPALDEAPFLAAAGPRDRAWPRVLAMAAAGLTLAFILGVVATGVIVEALAALGIDLLNSDPIAGPPPLLRSALYVLEISLALGAARAGVPFLVVAPESIDVQVTASVGVALDTSPDEDPLRLLERADAAMYRAKEARSGPADRAPSTSRWSR